MGEQSHNLKGKIEAMIQTVCTAQELYARAALVDHGRLATLQRECALVDAEETLRGAFWEDVRPVVKDGGSLRGWRRIQWRLSVRVDTPNGSRVRGERRTWARRRAMH